MRSTLWTSLHRTPTGVPEVAAAQAAAYAGTYHLVDVREPHEFVGPLGHIPGAELIPLGGLVQAARGWDRRRPIVVVCRSGARSSRAAQLLEAMGFNAVASMAGGMQVWDQRAAG